MNEPQNVKGWLPLKVSGSIPVASELLELLGVMVSRYLQSHRIGRVACKLTQISNYQKKKKKR